MTERTDLKPCPFCGADATYRRDAFTHDVHCSNDECHARPQVSIYHAEYDPRGGDQKHAERLWNTRAESKGTQCDS